MACCFTVRLSQVTWLRGYLAGDGRYRFRGVFAFDMPIVERLVERAADTMLVRMGSVDRIRAVCPSLPFSHCSTHAAD
jgi:hypothetical protein